MKYFVWDEDMPNSFPEVILAQRYAQVQYLPLQQESFDHILILCEKPTIVFDPTSLTGLPVTATFTHKTKDH